jgi:hypothetical protein
MCTGATALMSLNARTLSSSYTYARRGAAA